MARTSETFSALLKEGAARLRRAGVERPRYEAELLLSLVTGLSRPQLIADPQRPVSPDVVSRYRSLLERRETREPLPYLLGEQPFFGRSFLVDQRALVPRPETELLVELALAALDRLSAFRARPRVIDVGTGCGAVAISVALERPGASVLGTDISWEALQLARLNAVRLGATRVSFVRADLLTALGGPVDLLLANLPYVPQERLEQLEPELSFEPVRALSPGPVGTELLAALLDQAACLLNPGAEALLEIDECQGRTIRKLVSSHWPRAACRVVQDYAGMDRLVHVRFGACHAESL